VCARSRTTVSPPRVGPGTSSPVYRTIILYYAIIIIIIIIYKVGNNYSNLILILKSKKSMEYRLNYRCKVGKFLPHKFTNYFFYR